jgi:glycine C-acetyltransferase/8-amino-7-oxononanoate synthase
LSARIRIGDEDYLHFSSNDYLGLATDPRLKDTAVKSLQQWGAGSGASPLIVGHNALYRELEEEISDFKRAESALVFSSGYLANLGTISNLLAPEDLILSDSLNHASIVDGCRLAQAKVRIYAHSDPGHLEELLQQRPARGKVLVVTDSIFSMDGDIAPVPELYALCQKYQALLYVDDAHGTGVMGDSGRGILEHFELEEAEIVQLATFSKALGSLGGFVAGQKLLIDYLINKARTFIYSTALPPSVLAANIRALQLIKEDPQPRQRVKSLGLYLREKFAEMGLHLTGSSPHLFSLVLGSNQRTVQAYRFLLERGIYLPPIRPPTVPDGQSRLRISLSALHSLEDIDRLLDAVRSFSAQGA